MKLCLGNCPINAMQFAASRTSNIEQIIDKGYWIGSFSCPNTAISVIDIDDNCWISDDSVIRTVIDLFPYCAKQGKDCFTYAAIWIGSLIRHNHNYRLQRPPYIGAYPINIDNRHFLPIKSVSCVGVCPKCIDCYPYCVKLDLSDLDLNSDITFDYTDGSALATQVHFALEGIYFG
jgi:hypothetical protein